MPDSLFRPRRQALPALLLIVLAVFPGGCVHAPPEVTLAHQRELDVIVALQASHLAMIDAFVAERRQQFEMFFFQEYAAAYFEHWKTQFQTLNGRAYDEPRDFPMFSNDLVAEYQELGAPLDTVRLALHQAILAEYNNAIQLHQGVGDWIQSVRQMSEAQRASMNRLLSTVKPGLSVESIAQAAQRSLACVKARLEDLTH